jgi:hypothetical protein
MSPSNTNIDFSMLQRPLTPDTIMYLQQTIGNQAVQRLLNERQAAAQDMPGQPVQRVLMDTATFGQRAGDAKEDITLDIPLFNTMTLKKMSKKYKAVRDALWNYHYELNHQQFTATNNQHQAQATTLLGLLTTLTDACTDYIDDHAKAFRKAERKELASLHGGGQLKEKHDIELKRNRTIIDLRDNQIPQDRGHLQNLQGLGANDVMSLNGQIWLNALVAFETETALNQGALRGDPTGPGDVTGHEAPGTTGTFRDPATGQFPGNVPGGAPQADTYMNVNILATDNNPVVTQPYQFPPAAQLYTVGARDDNGTYMLGQPSPAQAQTTEQVNPNALFIGDGLPHADEIKQGGIGDCYWLAALVDIVRKDPQRLVDMMHVKNGEVSVDFYYRPDFLDPSWKLQRVTVPLTLAKTANGLKGARYKLASDPTQHDWWMTDNVMAFMGQVSHTLEIKRRDTFNAALWMPYLEKAYARFAQAHGNYGNNIMAGNKTGYERIEGGRSKIVYHMFYGNRATGGRTEDMSYQQNETPDQNLLRNRGAIITLLQALDANLRTGDNTQDQMMNLTAGADLNHHVLRALDALRVYEASNAATGYLQGKLGQDYGDFVTALGTLKDRLEEQENDTSEDANVLLPLKLAAHAIINAQAVWSGTLQGADPQKPRIIDNLFMLTINLLNLGADSGVGQRVVYSKHAYTVMNAVFKNTGGGVLNLQHGNLDDPTLQSIDPKLSTITLRNPHRGNAPDLTGQGEIGQLGTFDMTLDHFFQNFARIDIGGAEGQSNAAN